MKQRVVLIGLFALAAIATLATPANPTKIERAALKREAVDWARTEKMIPVELRDEITRRIRRKNVIAQATKCPAMGEIVSASVSKTTDTKEFVLMLVDVDGASCSLWLTGGEEGKMLDVSGLTTY